MILVNVWTSAHTVCTILYYRRGIDTYNGTDLRVGCSMPDEQQVEIEIYEDLGELNCDKILSYLWENVERKGTTGMKQMQEEALCNFSERIKQTKVMYSYTA